MAIAQIATSVTIVQSGINKGYLGVSLTNFGTSAESVVAEGSAFEVAGAVFLASGDTTPQASSWTAVATGSTAYIIAIPSGTAGSQVITLQYSDTSPAWVTSKQGWYGSAASVNRYLGGVYKGGTASYQRAFLLPNRQAEGPSDIDGGIIDSSDSHNLIRIARFSLGTWDMQGTTAQTISHGLGAATYPVALNAMIYGDSGGYWDFNTIDGTETSFHGITFSTTNITLTRGAGGFFDSASFNGAGLRGYCSVLYFK